jgi:hypothetical protein
MTAPAPAVRVDRTGKVWRGDRLLGYVDRWDRGTDRMGRPKVASTWRWVNVAGWPSRDRYPTRAAAVDALVGEA